MMLARGCTLVTVGCLAPCALRLLVMRDRPTMHGEVTCASALVTPPHRPPAADSPY